jgi:hypothetical protein
MDDVRLKSPSRIFGQDYFEEQQTAALRDQLKNILAEALLR